MSINMTQAFEFETDSLESFHSMLKTIVPILFEKNEGMYVKLFMSGKEHYWQDGKFGPHSDDEKPFVLPNESNGCWELWKRRKLEAGVWICERFDNISFGEREDAVEEANKHKKERKPTRLWITTLRDYSSDFDEEDGDVAFKTRAEMVEGAMAKVRDTNPKDLEAKLGDGYTSWFNSYDGHTGVGYRMHWEPNGGWNKLHVSLIHAYYGK